MGMKNADSRSPASRPTAAKHQPEAFDEQKQAVEKRAGGHPTHIGRGDLIQLVADVRRNRFSGSRCTQRSTLSNIIREVVSASLKTPKASSNASMPLTNLNAMMKYNVGARFFKATAFLCRLPSADFGSSQFNNSPMASVPAGRRRGNAPSRCPSIPASRPACRNQSSRRTACRPRPAARTGARSPRVVVKHIQPRTQQIAHFLRLLHQFRLVLQQRHARPP